MRRTRERGAASVEQAGLVLLVALLLLAAIAALAAGPPNDRGASWARRLARKLRCAPRLPGPCWRDPLTVAYGRPLAGAGARPGATARRGARGFGRSARSRSTSATAAAPAAPCRATGPGLTASNRRVTAFTSVDRSPPGRRPGRGHLLALPAGRGLGPGDPPRQLGRRRRPRHDAAAPGRPIPGSSRSRPSPGRNHYEFPAGEEPPWRWQVQSVYPGESRFPVRSRFSGLGAALGGGGSYQWASWCSMTPRPCSSSSPPGRVPEKLPNGWR